MRANAAIFSILVSANLHRWADSTKPRFHVAKKVQTRLANCGQLKAGPLRVNRYGDPQQWHIIDRLWRALPRRKAATPTELKRSAYTCNLHDCWPERGKRIQSFDYSVSGVISVSANVPLDHGSRAWTVASLSPCRERSMEKGLTAVHGRKVSTFLE